MVLMMVLMMMMMMMIMQSGTDAQTVEGRLAVFVVVVVVACHHCASYEMKVACFWYRADEINGTSNEGKNERERETESVYTKRR